MKNKLKRAENVSNGNEMKENKIQSLLCKT